MKTLTLSLSLLITIPLFTSCSNRIITADTNTTKTQTTTESTLVSKLLIGALTFYGTKGDIEKTFKATKFGGNASGYYVGQKLSAIQKSYKDKEEALIQEILEIDVESYELKEKNLQLAKDLKSMTQTIEKLENSKSIKEKQLAKLSLKSKLEKKKTSLETLLKQNEQIRKKISFSKSKANEYEYKEEDKKEILKSISFLEKSSQEYQNNLLKDIQSLDQTISTL